MSTVFQKTATDVCEVLDPREGLTVPFDLGNWSEIRVGVELSYVANTGGFNVVPPADEASAGTSFTNSFIMGFRSTGSVFPDPVSGFHIGIVPGFAVSSFISEGRIRRTAPGNNEVGVTYGGTTTAQATTPGNPSCVYVGGTSVAGTTLYAGQQGFRVRLTGQGTSGQFMMLDVFNNATAYVTPSVTGLRAFMSAGTITASGAYYPLTTTLTTPGVPLQFPNAFFIYSPFLTGSLRVHTIVIDRYA